MDSKSNAATSLSGFSQSPSDNSENVNEINALSSVPEISSSNNNNRSNSSSSSSSLSSGSSSDVEDEGFVSGQEELFDTVLDETLDNSGEGDVFSEAPEVLVVPNVEFGDLGSPNDDGIVENVVESSGLKGEEIEGDVGSGVEKNELKENLDSEEETKPRSLVLEGEEVEGDVGSGLVVEKNELKENLDSEEETKPHSLVLEGEEIEGDVGLLVENLDLDGEVKGRSLVLEGEEVVRKGKLVAESEVIEGGQGGDVEKVVESLEVEGEFHVPKGELDMVSDDRADVEKVAESEVIQGGQGEVEKEGESLVSEGEKVEGGFHVPKGDLGIVSNDRDNDEKVAESEVMEVGQGERDVGLVEKGSGYVVENNELEENLDFVEAVKNRSLEENGSEEVVLDEKIESLNTGSPVVSKSEVVEENDDKLTAAGDSFVEAIEVDTPAPGVAVVTNTEKDEDDTSYVSKKTDSDLVHEEAVNPTPERESVVECIDIDVSLPGAPEEAVVTKKEEEGADTATVDDPGSCQKMGHVLEAVVDKEVVGVPSGRFAPLDVNPSVGDNVEKNEISAHNEDQYEARENGSEVKMAADGVESVSNGATEGGGTRPTELLGKSVPSVNDNGLENGQADKFILEESAGKARAEEGYTDGSPSDEDTDGVIFGSSEAAKQFIEELERGSGGGSHSGGESSQDRSRMIDGQIVTDSDEDDEEEDGKELFDSAALTALLKAAAEGGSEGGNITISSQDGSRLFTVERPAGLGSSLQAMRPAPRPSRTTLFNPSSLVTGGESHGNLSEEEKKKLEKLQSIRVKFLRLVQRLGLSSDESVAAQVLYRLALIAGRQTGNHFNLEAAKRKAMELESGSRDDLDFSVTILVIGKSGVGKSATVNSIFGEEKSVINAFQPSTAAVKEIMGIVDGVKIRVIDTPGLKTSVIDQGFNRGILSAAKKLTKKQPPDVVLYVDRLDAQTRDLNDLPLLRTITSSLGSSIWRSAIVALTHGASAPPEGQSGSPLSYEVFVTQRSHVVQQGIGQAVGDMRMMSPSLMNPVSLVENHPLCRKNREGQKVLPNGQTWRPQLLMLCYSMKILSEANSLSKAQDPYDHRKLFGFRVRSPPLPYMLSSMLQSRAHPKLSSEQGGDGGDSDIDLADLSDSDQEEDEEEYDQLPPFKPLKKSQLSKLSKEQRNAYFDEYDYRVKLLKKKQWKDELKRMKEMKNKGKDAVNDYAEEEGDGAPAPVAVPLPDMALPPSFDSDNAAYRFRFLEPTSQFLARPVLDTHGWDHDTGYDGVNLEQTLAIAGRFPAAVSVQITKDKKDFSINMDSSISAKHGEKGSSMAGFDIQPIGKQLAYVLRGETKFKNLKKNKTAAGISVTFLGENVVTGFKIEDQITFGKQYSMVGSAGTVQFQKESAYGANIELQRRELDYPIGQVQSTFGLSIIRWRGDLALGFNSLAQFSVGRNSKVAVRAGINNKMSGQITVRTSSSEHLSLALAAVVPSIISAYRKLWPGEKYSAY